MKRIVVLGNGASGKSTFARELSAATGIDRIEPDAIFWSHGLVATPHDAWRQIQDEIVSGDSWILDGDLGPYDALDVRLRRADTVVLFDLPTIVCAWRAIRRSPERLDFWRWLFMWRHSFRPKILAAVEAYAPDAEVLTIRRRTDEERVFAKLSGRSAAGHTSSPARGQRAGIEKVGGDPGPRQAAHRHQPRGPRGHSASQAP